MAELEVEITGDIRDLQRKLKQTQGSLNETGKSFNKLNEFAVGALSGIAAAFSIGAIVNFGRAVLDTTAKFQKFEAVLTNTLGSDSQAQLALVQIQEFASQTPFAVDELTSSFVKLANQGFKPTVDQLRSLGDLASSTGKSFDQLAEAIIDAQVGEFERLKEFGIRAKKEGDNVTFTFKGVETQVKATDSAIRDYILSLGDAEGVSGAMAGISETLGGKLSNLGDNIESLKLAIGNQTSGLYATSIDWLNEFVALATAAAKGVAQIREEASLSKIGNIIAQNRTQVEELAESYLKLDPNITKQAAFARAIADVSRGYREATEGGEAFRKQSLTFSELGQVVEGFNSLSIELLNVSNSTNSATTSFEDFSKAFDKINAKLDSQESFIALEVENAEKLKKVGEEVIAIYDRLGAAIVKGGQLGTFQELDVPLPENAPKQDTADVNPLDGFFLAFDNVKEQFAAFSGSFTETVIGFTQNIKGIIQQNLGEAFVGIGDALGTALATGTSVVKALGQTLLKSIALFLGDLGQQLIAFGIAGIAFGSLIEAIKKGGPLSIPAGIAAIAAGVALVGISSAIQARAGQGLSGGGGASAGSGVGSGVGSNINGGATGGLFDSSQSFKFEPLTIEGDRLRYVIVQSNNYSNG